MPSTATPGYLKRSAPLPAAILLVVLAAHLAFMASPLHEHMWSDATHASSAPSMATSDALPALDRGDADNQQVSHCLIQWIKSAQGTALLGVAAMGLASAFARPIQHLPGLRPIARAIGPPATSDAQALLQVFRL